MVKESRREVRTGQDIKGIAEGSQEWSRVLKEVAEGGKEWSGVVKESQRDVRSGQES